MLNRNTKRLYFEKAAKEGYPAAYLRLWRLYKGNLGILKDEQKKQFYEQQVANTINWFQNEGEKGGADAQANLARCYEEGLGVIKDLARATKYYQRAANQGLAAAQANLEILLNNNPALSYQTTLRIQTNFFSSQSSGASSSTAKGYTSPTPH